MKTSIDNKVTVKLFIGCLMTSELNMHLSQSPAWKQAKIARMPDSIDLVETHFQDKSYIGLFLIQDQISLDALRGHEKKIKEMILNYCPDFSTESLKPYVFSQVFIN